LREWAVRLTKATEGTATELGGVIVRPRTPNRQSSCWVRR